MQSARVLVFFVGCVQYVRVCGVDWLVCWLFGVVGACARSRHALCVLCICESIRERVCIYMIMYACLCIYDYVRVSIYVRVCFCFCM